MNDRQVELVKALGRQLRTIRDYGHQPMYNGRPSCPFCDNFVDEEETHRPGCILILLKLGPR